MTKRDPLPNRAQQNPQMLQRGEIEDYQETDYWTKTKTSLKSHCGCA